MKGKIIDEGSLKFKSDQLEKRVEFQDAEIHKLKVCKTGLEKLVEEGKEVRSKELKTLKDKYEENLIYVNRKKGDLGRETIILNEAYEIIVKNNEPHKKYLTSHKDMRSVYTATQGIIKLFWESLSTVREEELAGAGEEIKRVEEEINNLIGSNKVVISDKDKTILAFNRSNEELLNKLSNKNNHLMICGCLIAALVVVIVNLVVRG